MSHFLTTSISQKLSDIIPHFLFSFSSYHTRRSYLSDLKNFHEFLKTHSKNYEFLTDIDESCILLWKTYLEDEKKLDPSSVRRKINCLSALFVFAQKRKFIDSNPVEWIQKPAQNHRSKTNALNPEDMQKIFLNISEKIKHIEQNIVDYKYHTRQLQSLNLEHTILTLLCGTGLRVNEVCSLKICNIEVQENHLKEKKIALHIKKSKGDKQHKVFLNQKTADAMFTYLQKYRPEAKLEDFLFVRVQQNKYNSGLVPIRSKLIYTMVVQNAIEAQITKKVSPHSIRAGVATILHAKGVPIVRIQKQLGHADISTTAIYIKKSNEVEESAALKLDLDEF